MDLHDGDDISSFLNFDVLQYAQDILEVESMGSSSTAFSGYKFVDFSHPQYSAYLLEAQSLSVSLGYDYIPSPQFVYISSNPTELSSWIQELASQSLLFEVILYLYCQRPPKLL